MSLLQTHHLMPLMSNHSIRPLCLHYRTTVLTTHLLTRLQDALYAQQLQMILTKRLIRLVLMMSTSLVQWLLLLLLGTRSAWVPLCLHWLLRWVHQVRVLCCLSWLSFMLIAICHWLLRGILLMVIRVLGVLQMLILGWVVSLVSGMARERERLVLE